MKTIKIRGNFTLEGDAKWIKSIRQPLEFAEIEILDLNDVFGSSVRLLRFSSAKEIK